MDRYDAETITLWPRLYHILPRDTINDIDDARSTLEFLLVLSLWCIGFAIANPLLAGTLHGSVPISALLFTGGILCAYLAYCSAIAAAAEYGEHLRAAFELYRFELLARLQIPAPANLAEERERWSGLRELILDRAARTWQYDPGASDLVVKVTDVQSSHE